MNVFNFVDLLPQEGRTITLVTTPAQGIIRAVLPI